MNFRRFLLIASLAGSPAAVFSEPLLPEKIVYQEASTEQVIPFRDGALIESEHHAADSVMYAKFDAKATSAFQVDGIQFLFDVEKSKNGVLFLGLHRKRITIIEENARRQRKPIPVPDAFHPRFLEDLEPATRPRLIRTNNKAAAIAGDVIWWLGKEWRSRKLPKVPQFYDEFRPRQYGHVHYLEGTSLYAGWNHGEWGGMLASIDLGRADSKWVHHSGKPKGDDSGIPQDNPVHSIISSKEGQIWVATGLSHLGGTWRGLHHRDPNGKWHTTIDGDFDGDRGSRKLPSPSSIQGITADAKGSIFILAGDIGILRLHEDSVEHVIEHSFFSHASDRGDYIVGSYPNDLGISRTGDIFVSTNSFGVLAFRKGASGWSARQITLHKPENKPLPPDSLPPSKPKKSGE